MMSCAASYLCCHLPITVVYWQHVYLPTVHDISKDEFSRLSLLSLPLLTYCSLLDIGYEFHTFAALLCQLVLFLVW